MRKTILTLCLAALTLGNLLAGPVDQQKAQKVGAKFLSTTAVSQKNADIQLNLVSVAANRNATDYYVFNVSNGEGFVIVAGDDRVKPILAYSTTGSFDPNNMSEGFEFTLDGFREEIQYVREHNLTATPDIVAEWRSVNEKGSLNRGGQTRAVVGPLCQTLWNQNFPWNSQCPEDPEGSGGHVYAGCVATAMGMVMKFWEWPAQGVGSHSYHPEGYAQQSANFGETEYHFELMPNTLDSTSTEEEYFEIAQLLHHLGISVDMMYSGSGSGAYSDAVPSALRSYFRYNCNDHVTNYGNWWPGWGYTNEEWAQMLKDGGLDELLPLYYSGQDDSGAGGHAYVCDGYDENDYFHFNWGWSGRDNAWCPIGALNTTRYAFNQMNGFTGHIIPQGDVYYSRPDSVDKMVAIEEASLDAVRLSWTNPTLDLNGNTLTGITSITIRRNFEVIAELTDAQVGADMEYEDNGLEPGLYEYAIFVTNEAGISRTTYRSVLVGEKCNVIFQLHDDGGDGWKGASISVASESGQRIAIITMTEGSDLVVDLPLLRGNLNFIWNHGWYHAYPEHDTDGECSFTILDYDGNELYASGDLEDGIFMTYENNCEEAPLACYPVQNLDGEYYYTGEENLGGHLHWDTPTITNNLDHFNVYRTLISYKAEGELIAEIPYDGLSTYEYFDNMASQWMGGYKYEVTCTYARGDENCESEEEEIIIIITDLAENSGDIQVYPNPTNGLLNIEGQGTMLISISNLLGQTLQETKAEGNTTLDMSRFESGMYLIRIETENGVTIQKVNLR
ncbi:MAG: thiol protease/hemagglutinin PrtT [Bacteroidales bacterium]|nr:thiol protease/hemagglutinin PrtT [Bacteroidales bacterium]